jgi:hypothetical protein
LGGPSGPQNAHALLQSMRGLGFSPEDAARNTGMYQAWVAAGRELEKQAAITMRRRKEAEGLADQIVVRSELVPRTNVHALNSLILAGREQASDEATRRFLVAINSFVLPYASAMASSQPRVDWVKHARDQIVGNFGKGEVRAAVEQFKTEMRIAESTGNEAVNVWKQGPGGPTAPGRSDLKSKYGLE